MGYSVRRATKSDIDVLVYQRTQMFRAVHPELSAKMAAYERSYRKWALVQLRNKKLIPFLVTTGRGTPIAGGSIWLRPRQPSPRGPGTERPYLMSMYTEPQHRRKGLATLLVKEAIKWSKSNGYSRIELHASDEGREVYAKLGFERTSEMGLDLPPVSAPKN